MEATLVATNHSDAVVPCSEEYGWTLLAVWTCRTLGPVAEGGFTTQTLSLMRVEGSEAPTFRVVEHLDGRIPFDGLRETFDSHIEAENRWADLTHGRTPRETKEEARYHVTTGHYRSYATADEGRKSMQIHAETRAY